MKKVFKYIMWTIVIIASVIITLLVQFIILLGITIILMQDPKMGGRDTVLSFGDGTYQVISYHFDNHRNYGQKYSLRNEVINETLIDDIQKYRLIKEKQKVYFIGFQYPDELEEENNTKRKYFILNYKTGQFIEVNQLNSLTEEDQKIFKQIKRFKKVE